MCIHHVHQHHGYFVIYSAFFWILGYFLHHSYYFQSEKSLEFSSQCSKFAVFDSTIYITVEKTKIITLSF